MRTRNKTSKFAAQNKHRREVINELMTLASPRGIPEADLERRTDAALKELSIGTTSPADFGFSVKDLKYYRNNLSEQTKVRQTELAEDKAAFDEFMGEFGYMFQGLGEGEKWKHEAYPRDLRDTIKRHEGFITRAEGVIELLNEELTTREDAAKAEAKLEAERRTQEMAEAQEKMQAWREKHSAALKRARSRKAPRQARNEVTLKGFGELLAHKRRCGKFAVEVKISKADAAKHLGGADQLATAFQEAKAKGTDVIGTLNDGRQIFIAPGNRYMLRA